MKLNEQISRMRQMFSSINENNFEKKEYKNYEFENLDIEVNDHGSDYVDMDIFLIKSDETYESYRLHIEYDYDEGEPQTYDYPGVPAHVIDLVIINGFELNEDGEEVRELSKFEMDSLYHNTTIATRIDSIVDEIFNEYYENDGYSDDDYDRDDW